MINKKNLYIRTDANPKIGMGHFKRCLNLAKIFAEKKWEVTFLIHESGKVQIKQIDALGFNVFKIQDVGSIEVFKGATLIILDLYSISEEFIERLSKNHKVLVIDDIEDKKLNCPYVLNQNLSADSFSYQGVNKKFSGINYWLMDDKLRELPEDQRYQEVTSIKNILISLGGGDIGESLERILILTSRMKDKNITVITGNANLKNIEKITSESLSKYKLIPFSDNFIELILKSDLIITACGTTIYEVFYIGKPCLGVIHSENQKPSGLKAQELGLLKLIDEKLSIDLESFKVQVKKQKEFFYEAGISRDFPDLFESRGL